MLQLLVMSALLGASSFAFGVLPLSFAFSKHHMDQLSAVGTGLLLGAALGVIIPEGIETVVKTNGKEELPTSSIALSLVGGFVLMLVIEQLISPHAHSHMMHDQIALQTSKPPRHNRASSHVEFDAELGELENEHSGTSPGFRMDDEPTTSGSVEFAAGKERAFPLTFGLVIHALADGLALGVSSLSHGDSTGSNLSLIVFLALIIHKAPTSLALTTSLLATGLPRQDCKKHLAVFASSTPFAAIGSYFLFSFFGGGNGSSWSGLALLLSGGTFLYVATVLQPVSSHSAGPTSGDMRPAARVLFIAVGMFVPFTLSALLGHGH